ncbi:hypothetical protein BD311DRAFT_804227 [Dichomitus squalens]|uniref:ER protein Pkr1-domain-containing protein n=1 Tax=Dichomitus squalens TaxID=114155 RepID=A0A4V2K1C7_9APHY|nr:hypothetical protein BD311DRAFT_804227 [Dichomitus squalens]
MYSSMDGDISTPAAAAETSIAEDPLSEIFSGILAPGSSLNPSFLLVLDGALATLLLVLLGLFFITNYNPHLLFLSIVELCLWASIKWFVSVLREVRLQEAAHESPDGQPQKTVLKPKED